VTRRKRGSSGSGAGLKRRGAHLTPQRGQDVAEALRNARSAWNACHDTLMRHTRRDPGLLTEICDRLGAEGGFELVWIGVLDESDGGKGRRLRPVAQCGYGPTYLELVDEVPPALPDYPGPSAQTILTGAPLVWNRLFSASSEPSPKDLEPASTAFGAMLAIPLKHRGRCLGVLTLVARQAGSFPPPVVRIFTRLGGKLAQCVGR
jgi:GAF domain-containing protein